MTMLKIIDMDNIKEVAKDLLYLDPVPAENVPFLCYHPYFENQFVCNIPADNKDDSAPFSADKDGLERICKHIEKDIDKAEDIYTIVGMIRIPYHFTFLKFIRPYLTKQIFDELLSYMWVNSENPNQDSNVDIPTFIKWFKAANKKTLMDKSEYEYYTALPEIVNVYRGVAVGRAESAGLSWTCNYDTAKWFSQRFDTEDKKGYILKGSINKEDIFAYFNMRSEDEICCDSSKVFDLKRLTSE